MSGKSYSKEYWRAQMDARYSSWADGGLGEYQSRQEIRMAISNGIECSICGSAAEVADHCHKTKKWRAPLCGMCNSGIGFFKDNPELLRAAAYYLEKYPVPPDDDTPRYEGNPFQGIS
jgi:hypothetical protein